MGEEKKELPKELLRECSGDLTYGRFKLIAPQGILDWEVSHIENLWELFLAQMKKRQIETDILDKPVTEDHP